MWQGHWLDRLPGFSKPQVNVRRAVRKEEQKKQGEEEMEEEEAGRSGGERLPPPIPCVHQDTSSPFTHHLS